MAELKVYLSEDLDKKFRMLAMSIFGYGRGSLSEAAVEALSSWCKEHESRKDPIARAEERPGMILSTKEKDIRSLIQQTETDETARESGNDKKGN